MRCDASIEMRRDMLSRNALRYAEPKSAEPKVLNCERRVAIAELQVLSYER